MYNLKQQILQDFSEHIDEDSFVLSIGTSRDWEMAMIEGGSNEIRVGTDIFGEREDLKKKREEEVGAAGEGNGLKGLMGEARHI
jgi:hypothetical protein